MSSEDKILGSRMLLARKDAEDASLGVGRMYCHWYINDASSLLLRLDQARQEGTAAQLELAAARVRIEHLEAQIDRWRSEVPT